MFHQTLPYIIPTPTVVRRKQFSETHSKLSYYNVHKLFFYVGFVQTAHRNILVKHTLISGNEFWRGVWLNPAIHHSNKNCLHDTGQWNTFRTFPLYKRYTVFLRTVHINKTYRNILVKDHSDLLNICLCLPIEPIYITPLKILVFDSNKSLRSTNQPP